MAKKDWFAGKYRRNLVDMHIDDWHEDFLSSFDPAAYVTNLKTANVQTAMIYANSHVGLCNWPTTHGRMHKGLKGRDILGELFDRCHREGMDVILYYSLIFDNWAYAEHAEWRSRYADGLGSRDPRAAMIDKKQHDGVSLNVSRYGLCCPNSEGYRAYTAAQIEELCEEYEFEGVFFDMTFWNHVCYCPTCESRFVREVGGEMPRVVDWKDPRWVSMQKRREEWLLDFGRMATEAVRRHKPGCTVNHQFSTSRFGWRQGVTERHRTISDYLGGDFYEGFRTQAFYCKYFQNISGKLPFEFHTSRCVYLPDHTSMKTAEELATMNYLTLAHQGATLFIDAIDPRGTLNPQCYELMGRLFSESRRYEPFIGGELLQDVALYFSQDSKFCEEESGRDANDTTAAALPHKEAAESLAHCLSERHIPYGVIGRHNLTGCMSRHQVLVLPGLLAIDDEEVEAVRVFVENGGSVYASGSEAARKLGRMLGVRYIGETEEVVTYIAPVAAIEPALPGVTAEYPLMLGHRQTLVEDDGGADGVLATITLPYRDPSEPQRFASIHSNPPGCATKHPAIILRNFGKGRIIWSAGLIEKEHKEAHHACMAAVIRLLAARPLSSTSDAPSAVEILAYRQMTQRRYTINLVNTQEVLPAVPAHDVKVRLFLDGRVATKALLLPDGAPLPMKRIADGHVEVTLPRLDIFAMLAVEFE